MKKPFTIFAAVLSLGLFGSFFFAGAFAGEKAEIYTTEDNLAVGGWDVVSYFSGTPVKGSTEYQTSYKQAVWHFSSPLNLAAFKAEPTRYEPQYGGYCAWGVAKGGLYKGDPTAWKIVDGKLYLNYNKKAKRIWEDDIPGNTEKANSNWPELMK